MTLDKDDIALIVECIDAMTVEVSDALVTVTERYPTSCLGDFYRAWLSRAEALTLALRKDSAT